MKILICPNAFKASLTSIDATRAIAEGIERAGCGFAVDQAPLADGGDGTLETLVAATGGALHIAFVHGPFGEMVEAAWGRLGGSIADTAVIEMAQASGLRLLTPDRYDPLNSSTFGTGELMLAAVRAGCTRLLVGIGGSATNDGGAGMAAALGAELLDADGEPIAPGGAGLASIAGIDMSGWKLPPNVSVTAACDVDNPLIGPYGAAAVYGPQKGATAEMVALLDRNLEQYASVLANTFVVDVSHMLGAGAAGGLGAGLRAFCGAQLVPGAEMVLDAVKFDERLDTCALVITGEGRIDGQTARGKVIGAVAQHTLAAGRPCIALVGSIAPGAERNLPGLTAAFSIVDGPMSLDDAMRDSYALLANAAERVARLLGAAWI